MQSAIPTNTWIRAAITRWLCLFIAWIVIAGADPSDLIAGIIAAALASWASFVLHPPGLTAASDHLSRSAGEVGARRAPGEGAPAQIGLFPFRLRPLLLLCMRLPLQSVLAGFDVARRALDPRLPLNPGFIRYRTKLPMGIPRTAFATIMSLVPGTLPVGSEDTGTLLVHCLDVVQPVAASLARDEAAFHAALNRT